MATYRIRRILKSNKVGITSPAACTLDAILKFDSQESPYCVYNEHVALRLAQTLHIPVADGALAHAGDGLAYASLQVDSPGLPLPDMLKSQVRNVAAQYPDQVAALVAFDAYIGNWDRGRNLKASLVTSHIRIFRGFDHEHALLGIEADPQDSMSRLSKEDLIVKHHPFFGHVSKTLLEDWIKRITDVPEIYIRECCEFQRDFRSVPAQMQSELAKALIARQALLKKIIHKSQHVIQPKLI